MPVVDGVVTVMDAPEGYVVDFDNPQRRALPLAYWVAGVGTFLSVLLMAQRLYTKIFLTGGLKLDDAFLIVAWITSITTMAICLHMFIHGAGGVHAWEISVPKFNTYMLDVYLAAAIYVVSGSCAKISLLIFYLRLSPQRLFRWFSWATLLFIIGYSVGIFFSLLFACNPVAKSWDATITGGKCINQASLYIATAVANILSDIILFVLPVPMVVKLQIPLMQKIGLGVIFTIGSLTVVTSIVRVSILPQMLTDPDLTWVISYASVWIIVEANLLIICAALPTLRKFFRHVAPKVIGESTYAKQTKRSGATDNQNTRLTYGAGSHARRGRSEYSQFDGDSDGNDTFIMTNMAEGTSAPRRAVAGTSETDVVWHDDDSEKGIVKAASGNIVQTKTVTVEYEARPGP